jgi:predicted TPR repeat methyltransferase
VLGDLRRDQEALDAYRCCAELEPNNADAYLNAALLLLRHGEGEACEAAALKLIALKPQLAQARFLLARGLALQNRFDDAATAYRQGVALAPRDLVARDKVCRVLLARGAAAIVAQLYREWLEFDPSNAVARHHLAALTTDDNPNAAPSRASDAYVQTVFDGFASSFEQKLASLDYRAPALIEARLQVLLPAPAKQFDVADLGCGTGLCAPFLAAWARRSVGCDLSAGMLAIARDRKLYDDCVQTELVAFLRDRPAAFDVIVSADTLCYLGDLNDTAQAAYAALRAGGQFVFTVELLSADKPYQLQSHGRYAHNASHLRATLAARGFTQIELQQHALRKEAGAAVQGWLVSCGV